MFPPAIQAITLMFLPLPARVGPANTVLTLGQKFGYTGTNGSKVTISLTGKSGTATIVRAVANSAAGDALSIALSDTNATSTLTITSTGGSDYGLTTVGEITDNSAINTITGKNVNVTALMFSGAGYANNLTLRRSCS